MKYFILDVAAAIPSTPSLNGGSGYFRGEVCKMTRVGTSPETVFVVLPYAIDPSIEHLVKREFIIEKDGSCPS